MKDELITLLGGKPILPGTVGEYYNVCGKTPCRCKNKDNPQKHGPYYQLSYNLKGKNSSISIKKTDVEIIRKMTDNYRMHIQHTQELSLELLELYKNEGLQAMISKYEALVDREISRKSGRRSESVILRETKTSLNKWKSKSIERRVEIDKIKVKVRDLTASRENWKSKAKRANGRADELQAELVQLKKNSCPTPGAVD
jgi:hypothetical protein